LEFRLKIYNNNKMASSAYGKYYIFKDKDKDECYVFNATTKQVKELNKIINKKFSIEKIKMVNYYDVENYLKPYIL